MCAVLMSLCLYVCLYVYAVPPLVCLSKIFLRTQILTIWKWNSFELSVLSVYLSNLFVCLIVCLSVNHLSFYFKKSVFLFVYKIYLFFLSLSLHKENIIKVFWEHFMEKQNSENRKITVKLSWKGEREGKGRQREGRGEREGGMGRERWQAGQEKF